MRISMEKMKKELVLSDTILKIPWAWQRKADDERKQEILKRPKVHRRIQHKSVSRQ